MNDDTPAPAPASTVQYDNVIEAKGEFIGSGASGIVERLPSGEAVKSPWPGVSAENSRRDMKTEFDIYTRLGSHPRLVKIINWNPDKYVLTMEYLSNGTLKDYIRANNSTIPESQRLQWAREATEGLQLLHDANVVHCDVEPKNFLLDANLNLKIADFSGSSIDGYQASACVNERFLHPNFSWRRQPLAQDDLFSLGSLVYFIMTGQYPFQELTSDEVRENYEAHTFPNIKNIPCKEIIEQCWNLQAESTRRILEFLRAKEGIHSS